MKTVDFFHEKLSVDVLSERTVRFHISKNGQFMYVSPIVEQREGIDFELKTRDSVHEIETAFLKVVIDSHIKIYDKQDRLIIADVENNGHTRNGEHIYSFKEIPNVKGVFGMGVRMGRLNKMGEFIIHWNTDEPNHFFETDPLYNCHPFFLAVADDYAYGMFFDNTYRSHFAFRSDEEKIFHYIAEGGELNYYFIYGKTPKEVLTEYTRIVGRCYLPPMWALGYQQSRWSYKSEREVKHIAAQFRAKNIPCDVLYLDIDYMERFKVFTHDKKRFKNFKTTLQSLKNNGFKVVPIVDPGVKKERGYAVYEEGREKKFFCTNPDGSLAVGHVWPGKCVFPDFSDEGVRKWWGEKQNVLLESGASGIWNDMNEPAVLTPGGYRLMRLLFNMLTFNYPPLLAKPKNLDAKLTKITGKTLPQQTLHHGKTHLEVHNIYGYLMSKASYEGMKKYEANKRPFVLTRSGFCGIQKYAAVWCGDNQSTWDNLALSITTLQNLSLSGVPFVGEDVGGFWKNPYPELFVRWVQLGVFYPFFRVHSAINTRRQEPWSFGKECESIVVEHIRLRYRLLPYIYSLMYQAKESGIPLIRSLFFEFPEDKAAFSVEDQFMFGGALLVAPVYQPQQKTKRVYLPTGKWYNLHDGTEYDGGKFVDVSLSLEAIPVFVKAGSVIPMGEVMDFVGQRRLENLTVKAYRGKGEFLFYEDDGESFNFERGEYNLVRLALDGDKTSYEYLHRGYANGVKQIQFEYLG